MIPDIIEHPSAHVHIQLTESRPVLSSAARVEAVMVATEAKAAVLQNIGATSRVTGKTATGTGTDAVAVVSGLTTPKIVFCGKHTLFGEMLASATMEALSSSLGDPHIDG